MFVFPGKKLIFMGCEFGQVKEWDHEQELEWHLLEDEGHLGIQNLLTDLNLIYITEKALYGSDYSPERFEWINFNDSTQSTLFFMRKKDNSFILVACNFTPSPRHSYRVGVPFNGIWKEIFNSDAERYGGSGQGNFGKVKAKKLPAHDRPYSITITLPPLSVIFFKKIIRKKTSR